MKALLVIWDAFTFIVLLAIATACSIAFVVFVDLALDLLWSL